MIMVEALWADQNGTLHKCSATMENTSKSGARIRLRKPIAVGTEVQVQWRWELFTGETRYCRAEGKEFLVGIHKDTAVRTIGAAKDSKSEPENRRQQAFATSPSRLIVEAQKQSVSWPVSAEPKAPVSAPAARAEGVSPAMAAQIESPMEATARMSANLRKKIEMYPEPRGPVKEIGKVSEEKKPMRRKWFGLAHTEGNQDEDGPGIEQNLSHIKAEEKPVRANVERLDPESGSDDAGIDLLSMGDIYQTAGIRTPRKGYSIHKIVEMLRSEHLRGQSKEMKRATILVALDAAGISVDDVAEDAKARMEAIDSYEASQRKQFEAHLVRRAEENQQIMAELERVKATYADRLRRNLEGVAREKATFGNWLTTKQQETANITEALELFTKPVVAEPAKTEIDPSLLSTKPV